MMKFPVQCERHTHAVPVFFCGNYEVTVHGICVTFFGRFYLPVI